MVQERWGHKLDYILTLIGYTVGVGSVWKFPYLCARNGGGSFLIPYIIFVFLGAIPMTYLEMFIGQYSQGGPISAWKICPPLRGVGFGTVLISWLFGIYYPVFFAWFLYYMYYSFFPTLPWSRCDQSWNSEKCVTEAGFHHSYNISNNQSYSTSNNSTTLYDFLTNSSTITNMTLNETVIEKVSAAEEFFKKNLLEISDGLEDMGSIRWPLVLCLVITFVSIFLCLINGVKLSGKIVYVTVTCPYILLLVFLIRSCTLPGSIDGILYFIVPDFNKLANPNVWLEALNVVMFMMGISYGFQVTMAAHNPVTNNCLRDAILLNVANLISIIFFGITVFSITGHVAYKRGIPVESFESSGFKLGFITYPEAASYLPLPQLWSVFLFVMLYTLGIDSLVPSYEVVTTMFAEWFPSMRKRRWLLNALVLIPSCLLAVPYMTQGGVYFLTLVEWYAFFPAVVLFAILECVMVAWIYGASRIDKAMFLMWGRHLSPVISVLWRFVCPILFAVVFGYSLYSYRPPMFEDYTFPPWATYFGWLISFSSILPAPIFAIWSVYRTPGHSIREKIQNAFKPLGRWESYDLTCEEDSDDVNGAKLMNEEELKKI